VDTDVGQGTLRMWAAKASELQHDGPPVIGLDAKSLRRDLARVTSSFDVVVIDCPPRLAGETRDAMRVANLVLLPVTPGAADTWALAETLEALEEVRNDRPKLRAAVILNRADRTTLTGLTREAITELASVLPAVLGARVAIGEAMLAGQTVVDYAPASQSATEVRELTAAVLAALGKKDGKVQKRPS
ncbi:MAG TPA: AAA family ATPase, partial [Polyangiaceae bacterium]|nr:AAA family ATPase [Polyangiaceae bacterium]